MAIIRVYKVARGFEVVIGSERSHGIRVPNHNGEFVNDHAFKTADVAEKAAASFAQQLGF